jgi:hypothetical protein
VVPVTHIAQVSNIYQAMMVQWLSVDLAVAIGSVVETLVQPLASAIFVRI